MSSSPAGQLISFFACAEFVTQSGISAKAPPRQEHVLLPGCHRFLFAELDSATGHFDEQHVIGEGGFGRVYRGALWCGLPVAIKRLDRRGLQVILSYHSLEVALAKR